MNFTIIIPTYNDSESLLILISEISEIAKIHNNYNFTILIVDDDSNDSDKYKKLRSINGLIIKYIKLKNNSGHQNAIFVGMLYCKENDYENILIMDGDGEDKPEDIIKLIDASKNKPESIIVAQRSKRINTVSFKVMYFFYKLIFKILTGKKIDFGNFCYMKKNHINKLLTFNYLKNNIAATIIKSKIPISKISLNRGRRYKGESKMNYQNLIAHALSSISVYSKDVIIRIIIFTLFICVNLFILTIITLYLRFFTSYFLGQAATVIGILLTIALLILSNSVLVSFIYSVTEKELVENKKQTYLDYIEIEKDIN